MEINHLLRKKGFYFVRLRLEFVPALWNGFEWLLPGDPHAYNDRDLEIKEDAYSIEDEIKFWRDSFLEERKRADTAQDDKIEYAKQKWNEACELIRKHQDNPLIMNDFFVTGINPEFKVRYITEDGVSIARGKRYRKEGEQEIKEGDAI